MNSLIRSLFFHFVTVGAFVFAHRGHNLLKECVHVGWHSVSVRAGELEASTKRSVRRAELSWSSAVFNFSYLDQTFTIIVVERCIDKFGRCSISGLHNCWHSVELILGWATMVERNILDRHNLVAFAVSAMTYDNGDSRSGGYVDPHLTSHVVNPWDLDIFVGDDGLHDVDLVSDLLGLLNFTGNIDHNGHLDCLRHVPGNVLGDEAHLGVVGA